MRGIFLGVAPSIMEARRVLFEGCLSVSLAEWPVLFGWEDVCLQIKVDAAPVLRCLSLRRLDSRPFVPLYVDVYFRSQRDIIAGMPDLSDCTH